MQNKPIPPPFPRWKRTLLRLLALVLVVTVQAAATTFPLEYGLFSSKGTLNAFEQSGFYRDYPALLLDFAGAGGELVSPGFGTGLQAFFEQQQLEAMLRVVFPEAWLRGEMNQMVPQFWAYYNLTSPRLDLRFDLVPIKARLVSGLARDWAEQRLQALPACSLEEVVSAGILLLEGKTAQLPACKPPQALQVAFLAALQGSVEGIANQLPDRAQVLVVTAGPSNSYRSMRLGLRFGPVFLLTLCLTAGGLMGFSWRRFLDWCALPLYIGGLSTALGCVLSQWLADWLVSVPGALLPSHAAALSNFIGRFLLLLLDRFWIWTALIGLLLALVGLLARFWRRNGPLQTFDSGEFSENEPGTVV